MSTLDDWTAQAAGELGIDAEVALEHQRALLDLARDAAHHVDRPAAPLTAFLAGMAVGAGQPAGEVISRLGALARLRGDAAG